jgi:tetratricopeptide (TPR) repeat protein
MRRLLPALLLPALCLPMHAESTGRISGKVLTKEGKPIKGAKITLSRLDIHWTKELTTNAQGEFMQVGLEPKLYDITVSAEGYINLEDKNEKIPLADVLKKDYTLLTPDQAQAEAIASGTAKTAPVDPGAAADAAARDAFNAIIPLYNAQKYTEALPGAETAYKKLNESLAETKDDKAKTETANLLPQVSRVYGICLAMGSPDRKAEAEPFLEKALTVNPKDELVLASLVQVAKAKGDKAAETKYQAELDAIHGPNPAVLYNKAVVAFNAGNTGEAKTQLGKVLKVDPKFAEAYYLMAMVEFGENNLHATKQNLQKYLELAPTGKNAATAKDMLNDPSLKHLK